MSKNYFQEDRGSTNWRLFHTADKTNSLWLRRYAKTYDEFMQDKLFKPNGEESLQFYPGSTLANKDKLGTIKEEDDTNNNNVDEQCSTFTIRDEAEDSSSVSSHNENNIQVEEDAFEVNDNSWDSLPTSSDEANEQLDSDNDEDGYSKFRPYTSLTEYLANNYYSKGHEQSSEDEDNMDFCNRNQLSSVEKLPMLRVLDALDDINKVVKVGKLTPRMERIMEYKQDHPFDEGGYEDDGASCFQWFIYKAIKVFKKFNSSQWPN